MLKALELFGFKSFADRTRFDFSPGVTGVVGPNGSGKSNVVDAIKWILGDQSPKSLRGKEMTDVIFNGSSSRKPAALAEATLTFDNRARTLSVDQDEVLIGRRIYRSGEAEYLINRVPARLKDVRDLFLGTGAGTAAYSIIEQGRVDQLLQASNTARRVVFEEAAGVSRYKAKKVEAQRKLERVAQNLLRLTDIVKEVETQLLAMRSQATKAAKFRELSHELRTLSIGLGADDFRDLTARLEQNALDRAQLQAQIEEVSQESRTSESQHRVVETQLTEVEDRLRAAERREAENRESIAGHEATIRHQLARRQELDGEFTRLEKQQLDLTARAEQVVGELQETDDSLQKFSGAFEERRAALEADTRRLHELAEQGLQEREALERQREHLLASVRQSSIFDNRTSTLELQLEHRQSERSRHRERLQRLDADRAACRKEVGRRQTELAAGLDQAAVLRERLAEFETRRAELIGLRTDLQQSLQESREQRSALQARKSVLEDLDRRQEGLGMGVKDILARSRAGEAAPWKHVLGHVVELLEVDLENAALLEVALGGRAQLIVLDEMLPLIDFLREGSAVIAGRVGFLSVRPDDNAAAPGSWNALREQRLLPDLSGRPGVLNRADRLVRSAAGIHRLAEQLLADTWIVSTLDDAVTLAGETEGNCRFVTLQGELLEANGTLFAGSLRGETALVSRKSELRGIKADVQRFDRQIAGEEDALVRLAADLQAVEAQQQKVRDSLDDFVQSLGHLKSAAGSQELELERLERDHEALRLEDAANVAEQQQIVAALEEARAARDRFHADLRELQTDIERRESELAACDYRRQELQTATAAERTDLAKHEERLENLRNARSRLDQERYQRDLHREEAERRFQLISVKRDRIEQEIQQTNTILSELSTEKQSRVEEVSGLQAERDQCRKARGELAERESGVRRRVRDLDERLHALDIKASEATHQLTHLVDRLREEFQIEIAEAAAEGISARQAYLDSQAATTLELPPDESPALEANGEPAGDSVTMAEQSVAEKTRAKPAAGTDPIREELEQKLHRCRRRLKQLGQVNTDSLKELDELEARFARLSSQLQDLVEARDTLEEIIRRINAESRRMFSDTFDTIRKHFQDLFRQLFGGGEGDAVLEDPNDILECGIDIVARPPGKELRSISLLSGGEKTMTAVALLLAVFRSRPSPFCILDEVDAALDEGNVERYLGVLREFQQWTQFIVITHSKRTMSGADVLYGVTMEEAGISKRMSVRFEDIGNDGNFTTPQNAVAA